jgi:hypothetical protein
MIEEGSPDFKDIVFKEEVEHIASVFRKMLYSRQTQN